jgi:hypothetical protein
MIFQVAVEVMILQVPRCTGAPCDRERWQVLRIQFSQFAFARIKDSIFVVVNFLEKLNGAHKQLSRRRTMAGVVLILCVLLLLIVRFRLSLSSIAPAAYAYCNAQPMGGSEGSLQGVPEGARLVMVQVLARHGDRSAIHAIGATQVDFECGAPAAVQQQWGAFDTVRVEYTTGTSTCTPRSLAGHVNLCCCVHPV